MDSRVVKLAVCVFVATCMSVFAEGKLKVLIVDGQNNHKWKETTPVMKQILTDCGRFEVSVASHGKEQKDFKPAFKDYDVVLLNYNGRMWPQETCDAFETYVREGGGVVVIHAADNSFSKWDEYNKMIGLGGWGGRNEKSGPYIYFNDDGKQVRDTSKGRGGGHGKQAEFVIDVREPTHPVVKGLPKKWKHGQDELYHKLRGPAENMTVIASAHDPATKRHEPVLMAITYGKGRVYHDVFGHGVKAMTCAAFQVTLQRGTEWAATGKVTLEVPKDFPDDAKAVYRK